MRYAAVRKDAGFEIFPLNEHVACGTFDCDPAGEEVDRVNICPINRDSAQASLSLFPSNAPFT